MNYEIRNFDNLLGLKGFSEQMLKNHFELYKGYVNNTNKILDSLENYEVSSPEYNEMKRRFGWEWNGMRLHEYYFDNLTNEPIEFSFNETSDFASKIDEDFGSYDEWKDDFKKAGMMRGIGWVMLVMDVETNKMMNIWVNEHDTGHLAGAHILLVMDVFEHAYMLDYGIKKADYMESFFSAIDWDEVEERYEEVAIV